MHLYPNSFINQFIHKTFIDIGNETDYFVLDEGEEQLVYPFFEHYLHYYINRQEIDKAVLLLHKLINTPNLFIHRKIIHNFLHLLIEKNAIATPQLDELIERLSTYTEFVDE